MLHYRHERYPELLREECDRQEVRIFSFTMLRFGMHSVEFYSNSRLSLVGFVFMAMKLMRMGVAELLDCEAMACTSRWYKI